MEFNANHIMNMKYLCVFLFPNFIKRARLTPLAGRFWPVRYMFDTPGLNDTRYIIERFGDIYVCHDNDINFHLTLLPTFSNFIRRAELKPLVGRFWPVSHIFDTPGLYDRR